MSIYILAYPNNYIRKSDFPQFNNKYYIKAEQCVCIAWWQPIERLSFKIVS